MPPNASLLVNLGIPSLAVVTVSIVAFAIRSLPHEGKQLSRAFAIGAAAWLGFTAALAHWAILCRFDALPPPILLLLLPTLVLPVWLGLSRLGSALAQHVPLTALVGFHAFRFPLELVMHQAAVEGTMPPQMTFTGASFDIVTGLSAIAMAFLVAKERAPRWLLLAWNALGTVLLFAIICIAVASLPRFHAFGTDPSRLNTWVAYFPFVWLPAGLVTSALFGHIVLWRRLLQRREGG